MQANRDDCQVVSVRRDDADLTAAVRVRGVLVDFVEVIDEDGAAIELTEAEASYVRTAAIAGHDESGRD